VAEYLQKIQPKSQPQSQIAPMPGDFIDEQEVKKVVVKKTKRVDPTP
jgi:hypothetical protein